MKTRIGSATSAGRKEFSSGSRKNSAERGKGPFGSSFTPAEIDILTTFADQAVIAIENLRPVRVLDEKSELLEEDDRVSVIQADERKVKQVLLNLLSNALKFTQWSTSTEMHGGRIWVKSHLGEGSEFTFTLRRRGALSRRPL